MPSIITYAPLSPSHYVPPVLFPALAIGQLPENQEYFGEGTGQQIETNTKINEFHGADSVVLEVNKIEFV